MKTTSTRKTRILISALCWVLLCCLNSAAGTISLKFANIIIESLKPGEVYSLLEQKKLPFVVINKSDEVTDVEISVDIPEQTALKEGYEAIPDPSWVKVVPAKFTLGPLEEGSANVLIYAPEDKKFSGRHYQVNLSAKKIPRIGGAGLVIASVLSVYMRFSVGTPGPLSIKELRKKDLLKGLDFDISPTSIYAQDVPCGRSLNLLKERELSLVLSNRGKKPLRFKFACIKPLSGMQLTPGYETGNPAFIKFDKEKMKVGGKTMEDIGITLDIPPGAEYLNKKYVFVISAVISNMEVPIEAYARVYVTTAEK